MLNLKDKMIMVRANSECYGAYRNLTIGKKYDVSRITDGDNGKLVYVIDDQGRERKFLFKNGSIISSSGAAELVDKYDALLATYGEDKEVGGFSVKFDPEFAQLLRYEVESVMRAMMQPGGAIYSFVKGSAGSFVSKVAEKVELQTAEIQPDPDTSKVLDDFLSYPDGCYVASIPLDVQPISILPGQIYIGSANIGNQVLTSGIKLVDDKNIAVLEELRKILRVPKGEDITVHAKAIRNMADALINMVNK